MTVAVWALTEIFKTIQTLKSSALHDASFETCHTIKLEATIGDCVLKCCGNKGMEMLRKAFLSINNAQFLLTPPAAGCTDIRQDDTMLSWCSWPILTLTIWHAVKWKTIVCILWIFFCYCSLPISSNESGCSPLNNLDFKKIGKQINISLLSQTITWLPTLYLFRREVKQIPAPLLHSHSSKGFLLKTKHKPNDVNLNFYPFETLKHFPAETW